MSVWCGHWIKERLIFNRSPIKSKMITMNYLIDNQKYSSEHQLFSAIFVKGLIVCDIAIAIILFFGD